LGKSCKNQGSDNLFLYATDRKSAQLVSAKQFCIIADTQVVCSIIAVLCTTPIVATRS